MLDDIEILIEEYYILCKKYISVFGERINNVDKIKVNLINRNFYLFIFVIFIYMILLLVVDLDIFKIGINPWYTRNKNSVSYGACQANKEYISDILTVDSILTTSTIGFIAFAYVTSNKREDNIKNDIYWKIFPIYKYKTKSNRIKKANIFSGANFSPFIIIYISLVCTLLEIISNLPDRVCLSSALFSSLVTFFCCSATLMRFYNFRRYWAYTMLVYLHNIQKHENNDKDIIYENYFKKYESENKLYLIKFKDIICDKFVESYIKYKSGHPNANGYASFKNTSEIVKISKFNYFTESLFKANNIFIEQEYNEKDLISKENNWLNNIIKNIDESRYAHVANNEIDGVKNDDPNPGKR